MHIVLVLTVILSSIDAHITVNPTQFIEGQSVEANIVVGHGCEGSSVTDVKFEFSQLLTGIRPKQLAGWNIAFEYVNLTSPVTNGYSMVNQTVKSLIYTAITPLPDNNYQSFPVKFYIRPSSDDLSSVMRPEESVYTNGYRNIYILATQNCGNITEAYNKIGGSESPAPFIQVTNKDSVSAKSDSSGDATSFSNNSIATSALVIGIIGIVIGIVALVKIFLIK